MVSKETHMRNIYLKKDSMVILSRDKRDQVQKDWIPSFYGKNFATIRGGSAVRSEKRPL